MLCSIESKLTNKYNTTFYWNKITKYNWHSKKNTDILTSNLVILNQAHRVAWIIGQERILKLLGELDKEKDIPFPFF